MSKRVPRPCYEEELKTRAQNAATIFKKLRMTQTEVSTYLGVSPPTLKRILAGKALRPSRCFEAVCQYAERLAVYQAICCNEDLIGALVEAWDRTDEHAEVLADKIRRMSGSGSAGDTPHQKHRCEKFIETTQGRRQCKNPALCQDDNAQWRCLQHASSVGRFGSTGEMG